MKVEIINSEGSKEEHFFDETSIVIGRGRECQIRLDSNHISREHLKITEKDGSIFIKDLSSSNWVKFDGEKLSKEEEVAYFDFNELSLPGSFSVKIEGGRNFEIDEDFIDPKTKTASIKSLKKSNRPSNKTSSVSNNLKTSMIKLVKEVKDENVVINAEPEDKFDPENVVRKKRRGRQERNYEEESKESGFDKSGLILIIRKALSKIIILCGFVYLAFEAFSYFGLDETQEPEVVIKKSKPTKKPKKAIQKTKSQAEISFEAMIKKEKCGGGSLSQLCSLLLGEWNGFEGALNSKKEIIVFAKLDRRIMDFLGDQLHNLDKATASSEIDEVIGFYILSNSKVLKVLEKNKIRRIKINFFEIKRNKVVYKSTYSMDTSYYRRFSEDKKKAIFDPVRERLDFYSFKNEFSNLLVKE